MQIYSRVTYEEYREIGGEIEKLVITSLPVIVQQGRASLGMLPSLCTLVCGHTLEHWGGAQQWLKILTVNGGDKRLWKPLAQPFWAHSSCAPVGGFDITLIAHDSPLLCPVEEPLLAAVWS